MSDRKDPPGRRPTAFRLDGQTATPEPRQAHPTEAVRTPRALSDLSLLTLEPDEAIERETALAEAALEERPARRFSFGKLFIGALGALVSLAVGLAIDSLVRDLFAREDWLGWLGVGLASLLAVGALGIAARESIGMLRLAAVDRERRAALAAYEADSTAEAKIVVAGLVSLLSGKAETAEGRRRLAALSDDVIDGRDMIAVAERELLGPLDIKARALVLDSAKRVSVVTAVSPKAIVDVAFVLFQTVRLIRQMSELYGARPGTLGLIKLTRNVVGHLAVTGSISIGDNILGQVVGHGLAARLSARLGEGVVNGLLTARIGLAAMDLCRPLPFLQARRPRIGDFASDLATLNGDAKQAQRAAPTTTLP
jgi:putative membrane protein